MYSEEELQPISALQHLVFCERQWALIHLEGLWSENLLTVEGRFLHNRVDTPETEVRGSLRIARSLPIRSLRLGLTGKADVVEFHKLPQTGNSPDEKGRLTGARLPGVPGLWQVFPIEYKRGRPKADLSDKVQLCAQALCLEEMLKVQVPSGALYYGKPQRRLEVEFDSSLRHETESTANRLHQLAQIGKTPPPYYEKKCESCSLIDQCLPEIAHSGKKVANYISRSLKNLEED